MYFRTKILPHSCRYRKRCLTLYKTQTTMATHEIKTLPGENPVGELFASLPELNIRQVARAMGVNETLMQQYVNGKKHPSAERKAEIENYLHNLGEKLSNIHF